jgi:hypothetical protein
MTTESTPVAGQATPDAGVQQTATGEQPGTQGAGQTDASQTSGDKSGTAGDNTEVAYEFSLPEGIEADDASKEEFVAIAKELKLPKEAAQKVVDLAIKREQARTEAFAKQVQGWEDSVKSDKELGGDKLPETLATCRKAIDLGPPELRDLLSSTKMGSHPAVVKWAYAVGKALSEDKFVGGGAGAPKDGKSTASVLYPNQS